MAIEGNGRRGRNLYRTYAKKNRFQLEWTTSGFGSHCWWFPVLCYEKEKGIGRFLSADPTIPYADNLQSYNRYSYVQNNPLSRTDPSGFADKEKKKKKKHKVQSDTSSKSPTEKPTAQNQSTSSGVTGRGITADGNTKEYRGGDVPWHQKEIVPGSSLAFMGMNASHGAHGLLRSPYDMVVGGYHGVQGLGGFFGNLSVDPGGTWAATKASLKSLPQTIPAGLNRWSRDPTAIGSTIGQIGIGFGAAKAIQSLKAPKTTPTKWPSNRGFMPGEGNPSSVLPGNLVDRYGGTGGNFLSPKGTPAVARSLAPGTTSRSLNTYKVVKPFEANAGRATPWFGQSGKGIQYDLGTSTVQDLINSGHLRPQ